MGQYIISTMGKSDLCTALSWADHEGWNPGKHDAECFYQTDPHGFFMGKLDDTIIAVGSAVLYDSHFAFCGFYMVDKQYRHQGYGIELTKARLAYVAPRNVGIDGVTNMLSKYERLGYRIAHNNARYELLLPISDRNNEYLRDAREVDFDQLCQYDRRHFPAPRRPFLSCWINQPGALSLVYQHQERIEGFAVIRPCIRGFKIGPLFAENAFIANTLFVKLAHHAKGEPVYLDIPLCNQHALALVEQYKMRRVFETARMYLKGAPEIELDHIFGITSFELG